MKLLMIITLLATQAVFAESDLLSKLASEKLICYGREYSTAHLKSRPEQTVQKIQAKLEHHKESNSNWMQLEVTLKGQENQYINYKAFFVHIGVGNIWGIECDGGRVTASLNKDGNLELHNEGFILQGACNGDDDSKNLFLDATKDGDDIFELVQMPKAFCQKTLN